MSINYPAAKVVIMHPSQPDTFLLMCQYVPVKKNGEPEVIRPYFSIPGGRIDCDPETRTMETFEEAAIREAKEETGLDVKIVKYIGSYYFFWGRDDSGNSCSCVTFLVLPTHDRFDSSQNPVEEDPMDFQWVKKSEIASGAVDMNEKVKELILATEFPHPKDL